MTVSRQKGVADKINLSALIFVKNSVEKLSIAKNRLFVCLLREMRLNFQRSFRVLLCWKRRKLCERAGII